MSDQVVKETDFDAVACRLAAISKGYLPSPPLVSAWPAFKEYAKWHSAYLRSLKTFVGRRFQSKFNNAIKSSFPVMNYGTYLRCIAIDRAVLETIQKRADVPIQIVNLGCGSDLRMLPILQTFPNVKYLDVDFSDSLSLKNKVIQSEPELNDTISKHTYQMISCDLRNVQTLFELLEAETAPDVYTIVITECALCYMPDIESQQLINGIIDHYRSGAWISYDPIGGSKDDDDRFGSIMLSNLKEARQLEMPTLMKYYNTDTYCSRWQQVNGTTVRSNITDMWQYLNSQITEQEKLRLKKLQILDELEELQVMQTHYILLKAEW